MFGTIFGIFYVAATLIFLAFIIRDIAKARINKKSIEKSTIIKGIIWCCMIGFIALIPIFQLGQ